MTSPIKDILVASIQTKQRLLENEGLLKTTQDVADLMIQTFKKGSKVLFCGNGGSAADAQHLAAEFSGKFYLDREPLPSDALHCNTSFLTAVANDYSYEQAYSRLLKGMGKKGDVLVGISTSGNSKNILSAFETARSMGIKTIAMTGETGGAMKTISDYLINVPSKDTPRIQECHITIGHIICQLTEEALFGSPGAPPKQAHIIS